METSTQNYFWLVDRLSMEDDPSNRVNPQTETVTLSDDLQSGLQSGHIFNKLLAVMHRTYTMRTNANFELSQQPLTDSARDNWEQLIPQLRQFGISINEGKATRLKDGDNLQLKSLITTLFEVDTSPAPQRLPQNASQANILKLDQINAVSQVVEENGEMPQFMSQSKLSNQLDPIINQGAKSSSRQASNQVQSTADAVLQSSRNAEQDLIDVVNSQRVQSPESMQVFLDQSSAKGLPQQKRDARTGKQGQSDRNDGGLPETLDGANTSAQFILNSLVQAFEMSSKQTAGLLSDNHRYLYHLCIKGFKGSDYTKVTQWYQLMTPHAGHLVSLLETETQNQAETKKPPVTVGRRGTVTAKSNPPAAPIKTLLKTLNILKGGLYSKDEQVVLCCVGLFQAIVQELNLRGGDIVGQAWDWLVQPTEVIEEVQANVRASQENLGQKRRSTQLRQPSQKLPPGQLSKSPSKATLGKPKKSAAEAKGKVKQEEVDTNEFLDFLRQSGLQGIINAFSSHDHSKEATSLLLLHFGKFNAVELFTDKVQQQIGAWSDYALFSLNLFNATLQQEQAYETLEMTGVLSFWVLQSLKVAESSGDVTLDDRISSLVFITEIWLNKTDFIDHTIQGAGQATLNILKRAARDIKQTLATVAIELMFRLLDNFAKIRHQVAPLLYKTLTFILVEFYWEVEIRDLMLRHFIYIFKKLDNIPVAILCEPLLKQVQISQYHATSFNVFDFDFFQVVAYHKKLNIQTALLLMDALTKIALSSVFYQKVSLQTMRSMIMRFSKQPELFTHWKKEFGQMVTSIVNIETSLVQHHHAKKEDKNKFFNRLSQTRGRRKTKTIRGQNISNHHSPELRLTESEIIALKTNQRLTVNALEKIIELGNELLNEELRQQLIDAFVACESQLDVRSKPITYLLAKYGFNVDEMISHKINANASEGPEDNAAMLIEESQSPRRKVNETHDTGRQSDSLADAGDVRQKTRSRSVSKSPINLDDPDKRLIVDQQNSQRRKIETAQNGPQTLQKSASQARGLAARKIKHKTSAYNSNHPINAPRSTSNATNLHTIQLYDYQEFESATNLLRYRHFTKQHTKLYREIFGRYEGNNIKNSRLPRNQQTFEVQKQTYQVISGPQLIKFIKDFDLVPGVGGFITSLRLRHDIPHMIKLINQLPECGLETKLSELNFEGFVEFLLQYAHQIWNMSSMNVEKQLVAVNLAEKMKESLKRANDEKRLMLQEKNFYGSAAPPVDTEQQNMIDMLNQKIAENPDYVLPEGYKKVQEVVIEESFAIPDSINMQEQDKICLEILDGVFAKTLGIHILHSVPNTRSVTKVAVDQKKLYLDYVANAKNNLPAAKSIDRKSKASLRNNRPFKNHAQSRISIGSINSRGKPQSPDIQSQKFLSTPQIFAAKGKLLDNSFRNRKHHQSTESIKQSQRKMAPELKLAIAQAGPAEKANVTQCAEILEEMLQAVDGNNTQGFSLVENEEAQKKKATASPGGRFSRNRDLASVDDDNRSAHSVPRYLGGYVSKRTQKRQQEEEAAKAAREKPISSAERRIRAAKLKDSLIRQQEYIQAQKKKLQESKESKRIELEKAEQLRVRALKHRKAQSSQVKAEIGAYHEKKEKEKQDEKTKLEQEKRKKSHNANLLLNKNGRKYSAELKSLRQKTLKQKEKKKKSIERQTSLPKLVGKRPTEGYIPKEKPKPKPAEEEEKKSPAKSKKPPKPSGRTSSVRKSSTKAPAQILSSSDPPEEEKKVAEPILVQNASGGNITPLELHKPTTTAAAADQNIVQSSEPLATEVLPTQNTAALRASKQSNNLPYSTANQSRDGSNREEQPQLSAMNLNNDLRVSGESRVVEDPGTVPETAADALPIHTEQIPSESAIQQSQAAASTGRRQEETGRQSSQGNVQGTQGNGAPMITDNYSLEFDD